MHIPSVQFWTFFYLCLPTLDRVSVASMDIVPLAGYSVVFGVLMDESLKVRVWPALNNILGA